MNYLLSYVCAFMCGISLGTGSYGWALGWFVACVLMGPLVIGDSDNPER